MAGVGTKLQTGLLCSRMCFSTVCGHKLLFTQKHDCYSLTRFGDSLDGNVLFVGHEAQHGEDGETCHEARAAVQATQHDAVSEEQDREN